MKPGSFCWFLAHDLRLSWRHFRGLFRNLSGFRVVLLVAGSFAVFHLLAWPVASWFGEVESTPLLRSLFVPTITMGLLFILPWIVAQTLTNAVRALYARGDLDLLLASPLSGRTMLLARALAIATEALGSVAIFLLPIVNMNVALGRGHWLSVYPTLLGCGLFGTSMGLILAMALYATVGPRRTRLVSQVVSTVIGAAFAIGVQAINIMPDRTRAALVARIDDAAPGGWFDRTGVLWTPVRAAAGDWGAATVWVLVSSGIFILVAVLLGEFFMRSAIAASGTPMRQLSSSDRRTPRRFRAGPGRSLRLKEWRLLTRDPWLAMQLMMQILYVLPIGVVLWRGQGPQGSLGTAVAPLLVVIASQLSAALAWLTLCCEDAPELLAVAPVTGKQIERAKLIAIAVPVALIVCVPLFWLTRYSWSAAALTLLFGAAAASCTALVNLWHPGPGKRANLVRQHAQSKLVGLIEHLMSLLWAVSTGIALTGSAWAILPIGLALILLWFNRQRTFAPSVQ
jgi:ABC-2 type transport system permease protein